MNANPYLSPRGDDGQTRAGLRHWLITQWYRLVVGGLLITLFGLALFFSGVFAGRWQKPPDEQMRFLYFFYCWTMIASALLIPALISRAAYLAVCLRWKDAIMDACIAPVVILVIIASAALQPLVQ